MNVLEVSGVLAKDVRESGVLRVKRNINSEKKNAFILISFFLFTFLSHFLTFIFLLVSTSILRYSTFSSYSSVTTYFCVELIEPSARGQVK